MRSRTIRQTILFQIICWVLAAYLFITVRLLGLAGYNHIQVIIPIRYLLTILQGTFAAILIGTILGIVDLFLARNTIRKRSFGFLVIIKGLIYIGAIIVVLSVIHFLTGIFIDHDSVQKELYNLFKFY